MGPDERGTPTRLADFPDQKLQVSLKLSRSELGQLSLETGTQVEVKHGLAVVAVVGEDAPKRVGLAGHLFTLIGGIGVAVEMISQGASRVNLSFVVREEEADKVVRLLHRGLGLDVELGAVRAGA